MQSRAMARKPTGPRRAAHGRATPRKGPAVRKAMSNEKWDVQQSRSVRSPWAWRGYFLVSLMFVGVAIILDGNHHQTFAVLWVVIAAGWFAASMWLWRQHSHYMRDR